MEENSFYQEMSPELQQVANSVQLIRNELKKVIIGQEKMIDLLITGLLCGGHILIEGVPGIAKTLTAKLLAKTIATDFSRIQFTPDLMPTDVLGTLVFNQKTNDFSFKKGPIFSNIVLIDEINRSPAKTQAALLEVMEELKVSMDGESHAMGFPFFVIATQNPIEQEGTYKLPEAQLDRFIFRIKITYPDLEEDLFLGASPRASLNIMKASKAVAAMNGRNFVTPDDIHFVTYPVLNHRIILTPDKELEGYDSSSVIKSIIEGIDVPR